MSALRLYAPVAVLVVWALLAVISSEPVVTVVGLLLLGWALKAHIGEAARRHGHS